MAKNSSTLPLLGLILAIPAVACYVWWTHLNTETKRQLSLRVRSRTDGARFGAAPDRNKLSNPIAADPSGASSAVVASSGVSHAPAAAIAPSAGVAATALGPGQAPASPAMEASPVAVRSQVSVGARPDPAGGVGRTGAAGEAREQGPVVISRDPMMSPFDVVRLQQLEYEKEQARRELETAAAKHRARRREPPIESRVDLEGIVSSAGGARAIVNGDTVGVGDSVEGAKIVRITGQAVIFSYKGRRFTKSISK